MNKINQFKELNSPFKLDITDKCMDMMQEYSEDFKTLKNTIGGFDFMVNMIGVDKDNRYKFIVSVINKETTKQYSFNYYCSLYDSFYINTDNFRFTEYYCQYKIDQVKKYKLIKNTINMTRNGMKKKQKDFIDSFLYSFLCCLKSDYYCSSEYFTDIDDFAANLMPDSKISEVLKLYDDINKQAKKMDSLFTQEQIESFPI